MRNNPSRPKLLFFAALFVALFVFTPAARAIIVLPEVNIQIGPDGNLMNVNETMLANNSDSVVQNSDGSVSFLNGSMTMPGVWEWNWTDLTLDTDPIVSSAFGFKNLAAGATTFTITVDLLVPAIASSTVMGGSLTGGVTDANFDGLGGISTVAPAPLYTGRIDGVNLAPLTALHPDPYSTPAYPFGGGSSSIAPASFGLPGLTTAGPSVATSIGIENKFSLSPGDLVSMTNVFRVEPVPEPSSIVLALLGTAALTWFAVRRKRHG